MDKFIHCNFDIGNFENRLGCDITDFGEWEIGKLVFKCREVCWQDFNEQTSVHLSECFRCFKVKFHAETSADAHLCGSDGETAFAKVMCRSDKSACDGAM